MVREKENFLIRMMKVSDAFAICIAYVLAYFITLFLRQAMQMSVMGYLTTFTITGAYNFLKMQMHFALLVLIIPVWISLMSLDSTYSDFRTKLFVEIGYRIMRTGIVSMLALGSLIFLLKLNFTSRMFVIVFVITAYFCLIFEKILWKKILDYSFKQGYNLINILIVGTGKRAQEFVKLVNQHANWGLKIIGLVDDDPKLLGRKVMDYEIIGRIKDIPKIIRDRVVDRVIFVVPKLWLNRLEAAIEHCEREGVDTAVCVDLFNPKLAQLEQSEFAGIPMISFQTSIAKEWQIFAKRLIDIGLSLIALILLLPVFIFTTIMIKATSKGPILFRQVRSGKNGRRFTLYKFRSMVVGAEMRKRALTHRNEMQGPVFKMQRDPRVTPFGRFMRKFSIDELPQLYNVIKGDLSLVGPRPALPAEVDMYESWQRRRLSMKPGVTCIWQVSGRNRIDFDRWMEMDLQYIDNFSIWLDFKILFRTIFVVLTGYGAA